MIRDMLHWLGTGEHHTSRVSGMPCGDGVAHAKKSLKEEVEMFLETTSDLPFEALRDRMIEFVNAQVRKAEEGA